MIPIVAPVAEVAMLLTTDVLPIVLPVVEPMLTGTVVVLEMLIPVKVEVVAAVIVMPCTVLPWIEWAGVVAVVVLTLIPVNGTVVPLKLNPAIVLLLIVLPPVVVAFSQMALTAFVVALVIG